MDINEVLKKWLSTSFLFMFPLKVLSKDLKGRARSFSYYTFFYF